MVLMRWFLQKPLGYLTTMYLMAMGFLLMTILHGQPRGMNGLTTCGPIGVTCMSRFSCCLYLMLLDATLELRLETYAMMYHLFLL
jgi:hypothetical protein